MNVESTCRAINTGVAVIFLSAFVAIGGTWAYQNWDWLSHPQHPLAGMFSDMKKLQEEGRAAVGSGIPPVPTNFDFGKSPMNFDFSKGMRFDLGKNLSPLPSQPGFPGVPSYGPQFRR